MAGKTIFGARTPERQVGIGHSTHARVAKEAGVYATSRMFAEVVTDEKLARKRLEAELAETTVIIDSLVEDIDSGRIFGEQTERILIELGHAAMPDSMRTRQLIDA